MEQYSNFSTKLLCQQKTTLINISMQNCSFLFFFFFFFLKENIEKTSFRHFVPLGDIFCSTELKRVFYMFFKSPNIAIPSRKIKCCIKIKEKTLFVNINWLFMRCSFLVLMI